MAVKVVDVSAVAAIVFQEPGAEEIDVRVADSVLAAPALLLFELTNVCRTKLRQFPDLREALLDRFWIGIETPIETHEVNYRETLSMAERFNLTAYDASYLWLARELDAELVTLDRQLARAAAALGQA
jgi:predicted nucleic acid-binding protein